MKINPHAIGIFKMLTDTQIATTNNVSAKAGSIRSFTKSENLGLKVTSEKRLVCQIRKLYYKKL